ncbi:MAG: MAPEG family protein, partial [Pseudomonadota bacterium]
MEMEVPAISFSEFVANYQGELLAFLTPVLLLVCWTLIMWLWMYATRIPAMTKAKIDPDDARHPGTYADRLPANVRAVADNYNHLHEQPTIFYALMVFAALTGGADGLLL